MAETQAQHQRLTLVSDALDSKRLLSRVGAQHLLSTSSEGLFSLLASQSLSNGILSKLSLEQQYQKLKSLPQPKFSLEETDWSLVSTQWLGKRPAQRPVASFNEDSQMEEEGDEEGDSEMGEDGEEEGDEGFEGDEEDGENGSGEEEIGLRKSRKGGKDKGVEDAEAELERQMQEHIDELNEKDEREVGPD